MQRKGETNGLTNEITVHCSSYIPAPIPSPVLSPPLLSLWSTNSSFSPRSCAWRVQTARPDPHRGWATEDHHPLYWVTLSGGCHISLQMLGLLPLTNWGKAKEEGRQFIFIRARRLNEAPTANQWASFQLIGKYLVRVVCQSVNYGLCHALLKGLQLYSNKPLLQEPKAPQSCAMKLLPIRLTGKVCWQNASLGR